MLDNKDNADYWKTKYYASLEKVEEKEKLNAESEALLRRTLSQLSLSMDGISPKADKLLDKLRADIRSGRKIQYLQKTIEAISETIAKQSPADKGKAEVSPQQILQQLLEQLDLPKELNKKRRELKHQLSKSKSDDLEEDITLFKSLIGELTTEGEAPQAEPHEGFFSKLFGNSKKEQPETAPADSKPEPAPTPVEKDEARKAEPATAPTKVKEPEKKNYKALDDLLKLVTLPNETAPRVYSLRAKLQKSKSDSDASQIINELAKLISVNGSRKEKEGEEGDEHKETQEVILQLLDRISLPEEFQPELEAIRSRVESKFDEDDINSILEAVAELISRSQSLSASEKKELEGFLKQITDTLTEIDSHIRGTQQHQQDAHDSSHALNDVVQDQMNEMQNTVSTATNLNDMKSAITTRLDNIRNHMTDHLEKNDERHKLMEVAMKSLINKVTQIESESEMLKEHLHQQKQQAMRDPLTGIFNRHAYDEYLAHEFSRWKRNKGNLTIVVWDIDHFKKVNDEFGHQAGDKALKIVASMLQKRLRDSDYVARYGGEEFVSLLPDTNAIQALKVADVLRETISKSEFHYNNLQVPITISCGVAQFKEGDEPEDVFKRADDALYLAKERGRNRCMTEDDLD